MRRSEVQRDGATPALLRHHLSTSDPERAAHVLRESYRLTGGVQISGDTQDFRLSQQVIATPEFAVTRFQTRVTVGYRGPLDGLLCVEQVHAGRLSVSTADGEFRAEAGDVCLIPPHESWSATTERVDLAPLTLDRDRVAAHAAAVSGIDPGSLTFTGLWPVSPAATRHWNATVAHVRDDILGDEEIADLPLVVAETFRMLATGVLTLFPNTAMEALGRRSEPGTRAAEPATIRRAVEFVDANAHRPIGVPEIAAAARIGVRGLQHNFRRYRGCTPLDYLRRVRLAGAHGDLQAGDPTRGDTVAVIAARWGFTHPGRFSVEYRHAYGRFPSETLRG